MPTAKTPPMPRKVQRTANLKSESSRGTIRGTTPSEGAQKLAKAVLNPAPKRRGRPPGKTEKPPAQPTDFSKFSAEQLLTVDQVREYLAISEWLARRLIKKGEIVAVYIGDNMQRVRYCDLKEFVENRRGTPKKRRGRRTLP